MAEMIAAATAVARKPRPGFTRKWWTALFSGATGLAATYVGSGEGSPFSNPSLMAASITLVVQLVITYFWPNAATADGVPAGHRWRPTTKWFVAFVTGIVGLVGTWWWTVVDAGHLVWTNQLSGTSGLDQPVAITSSVSVVGQPPVTSAVVCLDRTHQAPCWARRLWEVPP
jgi:hypothetical protein